MNGRPPTSVLDDPPPSGCRGLLISLMISAAGLAIAAGLLALARAR